MYSFSSLFLFKIIFAAELWGVENSLAFALKKKRHYAIRLICSSLVYFALVFAIPIPFFNAAYTTFLFLSIFVLSFIPLCFSYGEKFINFLFVGFFSYALQHIGYALSQLVLIGSGLNTIGSIGNYGSEQSVFDSGNSNWPFCFSIEMECFLFVCFVGVFLFHSKMKGSKGICISNMGLFVFSGIMILVAIVINSFVVYQESLHSKPILLLFYFLSGSVCIISCVLEFSLSDMKHLKKELDVVNMMWEKDRDHYELSSQTIKAINLKCHDLKHQIENMKSINEISGETVKNLEKYVNVYDSVISTGNHALDVVLTEKTLLCNDKGIQLTSVADGKILNFMENADIYSFFDNAISNAIRELCSYENREQRFIRITIKSVEEMAYIHIENYCNHDVKFKNGLIETTKEDKANHGYGLLSMEATIKKYRGELVLHCGGSLFMVDAFIPLNLPKK